MESLNATTTAAASALSSAAGAGAGAASINGPNPALSSVMTRANDVVVTHGSFSWIGLIARLILWTLQLLSTIIYFALKLTTISIPTLLFNLFSTSLTFTMNATTMYAYFPTTPASSSPHLLTSLQNDNTSVDIFRNKLGCSVPLSEHVFPASARASEEGARGRALP